MTAAELIKKLQELPPDTKVFGEKQDYHLTQPASATTVRWHLTIELSGLKHDRHWEGVEWHYGGAIALIDFAHDTGLFTDKEYEHYRNVASERFIEAKEYFAGRDYVAERISK